MPFAVLPADKLAALVKPFHFQMPASQQRFEQSLAAWNVRVNSIGNECISKGAGVQVSISEMLVFRWDHERDCAKLGL